MNEVFISFQKNNIIDVIDIEFNKKHFYNISKRIIDIIFGILGLILTLILSFIVKLSYVLNKDFDSIFYTQTRIGKNGKEFKIYKFRSMVKNADELLKEVLKDEDRLKEWKEYQKLTDDPRITKIGKILRKTSLDELPQFLNVLKGEMSLIGPRPLINGELESHNGNHFIYEKVKPGITGWWASHGRSEADYEKRLKLEYYYANNCSFILDLKCFFETIKVVLLRTGAK